MKKLVPIIALSLLIGRTFNVSAQYSMMTRGQLCPFDSAVAIHIDTYRLETMKLSLADSMIFNLESQLDVNIQANLSLKNQLELNKEMLKVREQQLEMKNRQMDALIANYHVKPPETWWTRNHKKVCFIGGLITGGVIVYMVR